MICISIKEFNFGDCQRALRSCERLLRESPDLIGEIRLDLCEMDETEVRHLFMQSKLPLIAICRKKTLKLALAAVEAGAKYIDIESVSSDAFFKELQPVISKKKLTKIFSYHNYYDTPKIEELIKIYKRAVLKGADIVKIATTANTVEDTERVLSLYDLMRKGDLGESKPLIAIAMGDKGRYSRIESLNLGAPFMYCSLKEERKFTAGQYSYSKMKKLFIGNIVGGEIDIPTSKSVAQRAIVAAALASGESEFHNFTRCRDIDSALGVAKQVGAKVTVEKDEVKVRGRGFSFMKKATKEISPLVSAISMTDTTNIFVGESGLLSRICIPIAAQIGEGVTITGEGSLLGREMYGCKETLEDFDAKCILTAEDTLPAVVSGPLRGGKVAISGKKGSQLISGLIMALPLSKRDSELTITNVTSLPYIKLTENIVKKFGIEVSSQESNGNLIITIPGKQKYNPAEISLEGDWSSAANFVAVGSLFGDITLKGLEMNSYQADKAIIDVIRENGGYIKVNKKGVHVSRSHLRPFKYDVSDSPDLFPILALVASLCEGESIITGVDRLRYKECNRTEVICTNFSKMGIDLELDGDSLSITGKCPSRRIAEGSMLKGGQYSSYNDHRIAMALMIASLCSNEKIIIDQVECINKSFPTFIELFKAITNPK